MANSNCENDIKQVDPRFDSPVPWEKTQELKEKIMMYTPSCNIICVSTFLRSLENFMQIDQRVQEIEHKMLI